MNSYGYILPIFAIGISALVLFAIVLSKLAYKKELPAPDKNECLDLVELMKVLRNSEVKMVLAQILPDNHFYHWVGLRTKVTDAWRGIETDLDANTLSAIATTRSNLGRASMLAIVGAIDRLSYAEFRRTYPCYPPYGQVCHHTLREVV